MGPGSASVLYLTLTRRCNLRCGFCPMVLGGGSMRPDVARRAVSLFLGGARRGGAVEAGGRASLAPSGKAWAAGGAAHIRFFGGEPLLRFPLLRSIVSDFGGGRPGVRFSFPTNGTLVDREVVAFLRGHPEVEAALSRVRDARALSALPNVLVQISIPPGKAGGLPGYLARVLAAGFRKINVLPAYFVRWTPGGLKELGRSLRLAAGIVAAWSRRGEAVEVRNASTLNPVPLFNHGVVVDTNGDVFPTNAVFCRPFEGLRDSLRQGNVADPRGIAWERGRGLDWDSVLRERLEPDVYRSTMATDELLSDFVRRLHDARVPAAPGGPQGPSVLTPGTAGKGLRPAAR
ncbi:MAG: hypothetical protein HY927_11190 [Elusimicrobia bacterium]|nr:hypothetical protein [Elusimicrobiota bacterium]